MHGKLHSDETKNMVRAMRREGLSYHAMAAQLGMKETQINGLVRRLEGRTSDRKKKDHRQVWRGDTPPWVLADREKRMAADLTPNQIILGDPVGARWNSNA